MSKEYIKNGLIDNRKSIPFNLLEKGEVVDSFNYSDKNLPIEKTGKEIKQAILALKPTKEAELINVKTLAEATKLNITDQPTGKVSDYSYSGFTDIPQFLVYDYSQIECGNTCAVNPFTEPVVISDDQKNQSKLKQEFNELTYKYVGILVDLKFMDKISSLIKDNQKIVLNLKQALNLGF